MNTSIFTLTSASAAAANTLNPKVISPEDIRLTATLLVFGIYTLFTSLASRITIKHAAPTKRYIALLALALAAPFAVTMLLARSLRHVLLHAAGVYKLDFQTWIVRNIPALVADFGVCLLVFVLYIGLLRLFRHGELQEVRTGNGTSPGLLARMTRSRSYLSILRVFGVIVLMLLLNSYFQKDLFASRSSAVTDFPDPVLAEKIVKLGELARVGGFSLRLVRTSDRTTAINAHADRNAWRIIYDDTTLNSLDRDEVLAMSAHEIRHLRQTDIFHTSLLLCMMVWMALTVMRIVDLKDQAPDTAGMSPWKWAREVIMRLWQNVPEVLAAAPRHILVLLVAWSAYLIAANAVSRHYERDADRGGTIMLAAAGIDPDVLGRALIKGDLITHSDPSSPLVYVLLYHTHPPLAERLKLISEVKAEVTRR